MDDTTTQLGLLMEAAQAHQKAAESSLRKLKLAVNELAAVVREEVHRVALEELHSLSADSKRAADALRAARRAATMRTALWSVGITTSCSAIALLAGCWFVPSRAEIAALRSRRDALVAQIASLEQQGGRIDLKRCGDGGRLCVRVDRKAPAYGDQSDYLIVRGY
jgi:hypothetical protein